MSDKAKELLTKVYRIMEADPKYWTTSEVGGEVFLETKVYFEMNKISTMSDEQIAEYCSRYPKKKDPAKK